MTDRRSTGYRPLGTWDEMRRVCWGWVTDESGNRVVAGSAYNRHILRPISLCITRLFVRCHVAADVASLLMICAGLAGVVCSVPHAVWATVAAAVGFVLFDLLDAVDGEIARWQGTSSTRGLYLDKLSHLLIEHPSLAIPALHLYALTGDALYLGLGATTAFTSLLAMAARETMMRINAETRCRQSEGDQEPDGHSRAPPSAFARICLWARQNSLLAFPVAKSRVVHFVSIVAIGASHTGWTTGLIGLAWFYGAYCVVRTLVELPYFYLVKVVHSPHNRRPKRSRWFL